MRRTNFVQVSSLLVPVVGLICVLLAACGGGSYSPTQKTTTAPGPQVISTLPSSGATSVSTNSSVAVTFDSNLNVGSLSSSVSVNCGGTVIPGSVAYDATNHTLVIHFSSTLPTNTQCTVTLSGIQDATGNPMSQPLTFTFTTGNSADLTAPAVVAFSPAANATGVPSTAKVTVQFSKAMDPTILNGRTNTGLAGSYTYDPNTFTATLVPSTPLQPNATYTVTVSGTIRDMEGNVLGQDLTWSFSTGQ